MPRKRKLSRFQKEKSIKKPKRKEKFNYRAAPYIRDRDAKNEEIENRRKRLEEHKSKQKVQYDDDESSEEEENPLTNLLKTFGDNNKINKIAIVSDSESETEDEDVDEDIDDDKEGMDSDVEDMENMDSDVEDMEDVEKGDTEEDISENDVDQDIEEDIEEEEIENIDNINEYEESDNADQLESNQLESINAQQILGNIKDKNEEDEETAKEDAGHVNDPFSIHLRNNLDNDLYEAMNMTTIPVKTGKLNWPILGNIIYQIPTVEEKLNETNKKLKVSVLEDTTYAEHGKVPELIDTISWNNLYVKSQIQNNISRANIEHIKDNLDKNPSPLTSFQKELFSIINNYQDLLYAERTNDNESQLRFMYCLHAVNHVLKTRTKVLHHNSKIQKAKLIDSSKIPDEYRDQGLVRPKVLIIVPFRYSCLKIVEMLISIFIGEDKGGSVINKIRFMEDFGSSEVVMPKKNPKPEDYEQTFKGNIDDSFKIGLSITKKAIRLYSEFYSSDIIISSILGLRTIIGAEGEEGRDYDFLASVEVLIMDQMEIFLMQNWDHLIHILNHMHLQPKKSHDTDFSRIRSWCINGWSKYYRQTLLFSGIQLPEIHGIFNRFCYNYAGKLKVMNSIEVGSVAQVIVQIPQVFHRFNVKDYSKSIEARFDFFISKILPQYKDSIMNHTLIFIPSYFDYVKVRNYFRKEELSFVQICEYTRKPKVARARDIFFHSDAHFLLYTERYHFFRRIRVKGIRHIIFFAPPIFPHFYSEMCNLMQEAYQNSRAGSPSNMTVTIIYCKYDLLLLSSIVGNERAGKMVTSDKDVHMIITDG